MGITEKKIIYRGNWLYALCVMNSIGYVFYFFVISIGDCFPFWEKVSENVCDSLIKIVPFDCILLSKEGAWREPVGGEDGGLLPLHVYVSKEYKEEGAGGSRWEGEGGG